MNPLFWNSYYCVELYMSETKSLIFLHLGNLYGFHVLHSQFVDIHVHLGTINLIPDKVLIWQDLRPINVLLLTVLYLSQVAYFETRTRTQRKPGLEKSPDSCLDSRLRNPDSSMEGPDSKSKKLDSLKLDSDNIRNRFSSIIFNLPSC